ncbi:MAG: RNA polymerase sigma factor [Lachnospiraceae bacterium]|nr:RNA polymerase sigma factor [Lachnospiraceae bacterium]
MEDDKIVDLYIARNEEAIRHTCEKYGGKLSCISLRITEDAQTAEECENDTYLEAWNRIPPNEPRTYFFPFLSRIIRNISINRCIEKKRIKRTAFIVELTSEMEQCIPNPDDVEGHMEAEELGRVISVFLHRLPKEKRLMFMHRYYHLDSIPSIAKRFCFSESKVKTTLFRIRNDLKDYLFKEGYII